MRIETDAGAYSIEIDNEAIKKMELAGMKPLKTIERCYTDDPLDAIEYSYIVKVLDLLAVLVEQGTAPSSGIEQDMLSSGYGFGDFLEIFSKLFAESDFLGRRRLTPTS